MPDTLCGCGQQLHYTEPQLRQLVDTLVDHYGPTLVVTSFHGAWLFAFLAGDVPRHYIALHAAVDLPQLAAKYGWERADQ